MRSSGSPEWLSLDRDLPTTPDDVTALARLRAAAPADLATHLRFLASFPPPPSASLCAPRGPGGAPVVLAATRQDDRSPGNVPKPQERRSKS
jgi:hypothetical protein